jgi:hypothetical protein
MRERRGEQRDCETGTERERERGRVRGIKETEEN